MGILIFLAFMANAGWAYVDDHASPITDNRPDPREKILAEHAKGLCNPTPEYIKTLEFLRSSKEVLLPDPAAKKVADKVSRGCDGASERFTKVLRVLKASGYSDAKSLELALSFSSMPGEVQDNFTEIFSRAFLAEFFDYEHRSALAIALELSKDYTGDPAQVREDFIELARFCKGAKDLDLPAKACADYSVKVARLSQLYPEGVRKPFLTFFARMREDKEFAMDIKSALDITYNVLKSGPRAADNFFSGFEFAMKESGLGLSHTEALEFGLKMAARSYVGKKPPVVPRLPPPEVESEE